MVDIEEGPLRPLEQHARFHFQGAVQEHHGIRDEWAEDFRRS
jgi:hypothetical protein